MRRVISQTMNIFGEIRGIRPSVVLSLGIVLAASAAYLVALLFGYVFAVGSARRHHVESASYIFAAAALTVAVTRGQRVQAVPLTAPTAPWLVVIFVASAAALYGNTISLGLFSDDFVLAGSALAGDWLPQPDFVRPLPLVIWRAILEVTGSPAALHTFSVFLHGLNGALVAILARRLGLPAVNAIAAGALFVAFPGSVEAVVWPAAVHDLLVTGCALGFLVLSGGHSSAYRLILAGGLIALGLLSKESAVVIPVLGLVLWAGGRQRERQTVSWPVLMAGAAVCLLYGVLRMSLTTMPGSYTQEPSRYVLKELIARPIGTLALPWNSSVFAAWPALPFLSGAMCVAIGSLYAWRVAKPVALSAVLRCLVAMIVAVLPAYSMLFITADLEKREISLPVHGVLAHGGARGVQHWRGTHARPSHRLVRHLPDGCGRCSSPSEIVAGRRTAPRTGVDGRGGRPREHSMQPGVARRRSRLRSRCVRFQERVTRGSRLSHRRGAHKYSGQHVRLRLGRHDLSESKSGCCPCSGKLLAATAINSRFSGSL